MHRSVSEDNVMNLIPRQIADGVGISLEDRVDFWEDITYILQLSNIRHNLGHTLINDVMWMDLNA
ncbi:hypothetical protein JCM10914_4598 [Paenibacillus sp. JCM 10914]|nr:hypothetical protein JCM10914_4598 [Paenibacillus sp. JCM 10914]